MKLELPTVKLGIESKSPNVLVLYSKPKVGKTTCLSYLDGCLNLDLEEGTKYVEALKLRAKSVEDIKAIGDEITKAGKPYKYIAVDTVTALEEMCMPYALKLYRKTPLGANFAGESVLTLPKGAGYYYLREAYTKVINYIKTLAPRVILVGHLKESMIDKEGKEVSTLDLELTGRLKSMTCGNSDAIGYLYREGNKTYVTFNSSDMVLCGSRPEHLRGKTIMLAEPDENGKLITHWDEIYID